MTQPLKQDFSDRQRMTDLGRTPDPSPGSISGQARFPPLLAYLQIALAMIILGINVPASKFVLAEVTPIVFFFLRALIASLVLIPISIGKRSILPQLGLRGWLGLTALSTTGIVLFSLLLLFGMQHTTALSAGIITSSLPAAVALLSVLILKEHIDKRRLLGIGLAIAAVLALNLEAGSSGELGSLLGNSLIVLAVFSEAVFTILAKRFSLRLSPLTVVVWINWIALLLVLPISLGPALAFDYKSVSLVSWMLLLWITLSSSLLSFLLWYKAIARVEASLAGLFTALIPISSTAVAILVLGETATLWHGLSILAVLAAIVISTGWRQQTKSGINTNK